MALKVTQTRSAIGSKPKQRGTLRALGLGRIGRSNLLPDRPEIHGMIHRVPHLVTVERVGDDTTPAADAEPVEDTAPVQQAAKKATTKKSTAKKATASKAVKKATAEKPAAGKAPAKKASAKKASAKSAVKKSASGSGPSGSDDDEAST
jgi:large subunit ribosomal protein L30